MPEPENSATQSVFDREVELPRDETAPGRRRRQTADWGGDELFARMPRRRFDHEAGQRSRRSARANAEESEEPARANAEEPERSRGVRRPPADDWGLDAAPSAPVDDWGVDAAPSAPVDDWWLDAAPSAPTAEAEEAPGPPPPAPAEALPVGAAELLGSPEGGVPGRRRTVVIGRIGATSRESPFAPVSRRRPPPTVAERIGGQPERMVAWAFALGLVLILIAIATAQT